MITVNREDHIACIAKEHKEMTSGIADAVQLLEKFYDIRYSSWHSFAEEGEEEPEEMQAAQKFIKQWKVNP